MSDPFRGDLLELAIRTKKSQYFSDEVQVVVDHSRFPFVIKCNGRTVAHLFASALEGAFLKMVNFVHEYNRLVDEKSQLIRIINQLGGEIPSSIVQEKPIRINSGAIDGALDSNGEYFSIEVGQIWKSKKSIDRYRVEAVNASTGEVKLIWLGRSYYERIVPLGKLPRFYELEREDDDDDTPADDES